MVVAAIDLSLTCTGWAIGSAGKLVDRGRIVPTLLIGEIPRLLLIRNAVMNVIEEAKADLVVFEDFSFASNMSGAREIAGAAYSIRMELFTDGKPYFCVSPQALKKFIAGRGSTKKEKVPKEKIILEVFKRWGVEAEDNNVADAIGLAYVGMAFAGEWDVTIEAQAEVLAVLKAKNSKIVIR